MAARVSEVAGANEDVDVRCESGEATRGWDVGVKIAEEEKLHEGF